MKKWLCFGSILLASITFSGCSFQQYFTLVNATDQPITISYSLENPSDVNSIFTTDVNVYQASRDLSPDWEHSLNVSDLDFSENGIKLKLPAKSALVFGTLSNERYDAEKQISSSGKVFNLEEMSFKNQGYESRINRNNFVNFFLKEDGFFRYIIQ